MKSQSQSQYYWNQECEAVTAWYDTSRWGRRRYRPGCISRPLVHPHAQTNLQALSNGRKRIALGLERINHIFRQLRHCRLVHIVRQRDEALAGRVGGSDGSLNDFLAVGHAFLPVRGVEVGVHHVVAQAVHRLEALGVARKVRRPHVDRELADGGQEGRLEKGHLRDHVLLVQGA